MPQTLWVSEETNDLIKQARSLTDGEREKTQIVRDALRTYIDSRRRRGELINAMNTLTDEENPGVTAEDLARELLISTERIEWRLEQLDLRGAVLEIDDGLWTPRQGPIGGDSGEI